MSWRAPREISRCVVFSGVSCSLRTCAHVCFVCLCPCLTVPQEEVLQSEDLVLVEFFAPWSCHCSTPHSFHAHDAGITYRHDVLGAGTASPWPLSGRRPRLSSRVRTCSPANDTCTRIIHFADAYTFLPDHRQGRETGGCRCDQALGPRRQVRRAGLPHYQGHTHPLPTPSPLISALSSHGAPHTEHHGYDHRRDRRDRPCRSSPWTARSRTTSMP